MKVIRPRMTLQIARRAGRAVLTLLFPGLLSGCGWVRLQQTRCDQRCEQLCADARAAQSKGEAFTARQLVDAALRNHPQDLNTRLRIVELLWQQGRSQAALSGWQSLEQECGDDPRPVLRQAECAWELCQYDYAYEKAIQAIRMNPQAATAWRIRALDEVRRGKLDQAIATCQAWSDSVPNDPESLLTLGGIQLRRGHPDRAAPILRQVLHNPQASQLTRLEAEWLLGKAYAQTERWSETVAIWSRILPQKSDATTAEWYQLAEAHWRTGDEEGTRSILKTILEKEPEHPECRKLLAELPSAPLVRTAAVTSAEAPANRVIITADHGDAAVNVGFTRPPRN